jgi:hypothetical protein
MTKPTTTKRSVIVTTKMTQGGSDAIDSRRGGWSRSEYVRQALALAMRHGLRGPETDEV